MEPCPVTTIRSGNHNCMTVCPVTNIKKQIHNSMTIYEEDILNVTSITTSARVKCWSFWVNFLEVCIYFVGILKKIGVNLVQKVNTSV